MHALPEGSELRICILDGFLVYTDPKSEDNEMTQLHDLTELMDLKLFVSCSRSQTIERRTRRKGYVTLEGFWEDPPGYVEDVVWPNFVRDHAWLCKDEGEEGHLVIDEDAARREHIVLGPGRGEKELEELIIWGVDAVKEAVGR
jgi:nicotinamide/nicotinate riboside kinase